MALVLFPRQEFERLPCLIIVWKKNNRNGYDVTSIPNFIKTRPAVVELKHGGTGSNPFLAL
jgi:hypothetical protein